MARKKSPASAPQPAGIPDGLEISGAEVSSAVLAAPEPAEFVRVTGARTHNLKNVDIDIPRDRLVVFSGVSGSGKSSLLFDTVYAEGQRRFLETLSTYARTYLDQLDKPEVDSIEGLPPTVAIDQRVGTFSPRSSVGTITEIYDYLRLLFSKEGTPFCPDCRVAVRTQSPDRIAGIVMGLPEGTRVILMAPMIKGRKGYHKEIFETLRKAGLIRARVDGATVEIDPPPALDRNTLHTIEAVVDRLVVREGIAARLGESLATALKLGEGVVILSIENDGQWADTLLSTRAACPDCSWSLPDLEPRSFSFNSHYGACAECDGLGFRERFDPDLVMPDHSLALSAGLVAPWHDPALFDRIKPPWDTIDRWLGSHGLKKSAPFGTWPAAIRTKFFEGEKADQKAEKPGFEGLEKILASQWEAAGSEKRRAALAAYRTRTVCPACSGARLRPESRAVRFEGLTIEEIVAWPLDRAEAFFRELRYEAGQNPVGAPIVREIAERLSFLNRVGLSYLTLDRPAETLSGGELQRVRLGAQVGSGLIGIAYVLDEPTAGLHPRDTEKLIETLFRLRDQGNSVLVVEHDESMIRSADWLIEVGPGAGPDGGTIVGSGRPEEAVNWHDSPTAAALQAPTATLENGTGLPPERSSAWLTLKGAAEHNLKNVDIRIPIGKLTSVTGVSGSGKSTIVHDILAPAVGRAIGLKMPRPGRFASLSGTETILRMILVDQSPIGRTPRSTPATYTGLLDEIRKTYAGTRDAKLRGFMPARFSYNVAEGRCPKCEGQGQLKLEMQFLSDSWMQCPECRGLRYDRATLAVTFKGYSIGKLLMTRIDEAIEIFENVPRVLAGLTALHEVGLGYLTLGQSSTTLSGGEAQRVKLAAELARPSNQPTLFLLDEPTTGLHSGDVANLTRILKRLTEQGHTVVVIEHQLDLIARSDWVIDLGPEAGEQGGELVAMGPPATIARCDRSWTGKWLADPGRSVRKAN